jgi:hypothetical protein
MADESSHLTTKKRIPTLYKVLKRIDLHFLNLHADVIADIRSAEARALPGQGMGRNGE